MFKKDSFVHPYIPNSVPRIKLEMLREIGVKDVEELYKEIPEKLRFKEKLNIPGPILSEYELKTKIMKILSKDVTCEDYLNFLGGGCWQHYAPAVCDEIISRAEFLTAYAGEVYSDTGKYQAFFEFQSQIGELVGMEAVSLPLYSWGVAAAFAIRMASRIVRKNEVLIPRTIAPERLATIKNFCGADNFSSQIILKMVDYNKIDGQLDLGDLKKKISSKTAAIYFENPTYLGFIEAQSKEISELAHKNYAISIVGIDPISLGVLISPADYGADIVVGTGQPLGVHMNCGGGTFGFIATHDEEKYIAENPSLLISITNTSQTGEYGFGQCTWDRTSYMGRDELGKAKEESKDFIGTISNLWAIAASVYMSLMGPQGFKEIGNTIIEKNAYAKKLISQIHGVKILFPLYNFKEFVVNFDATGKSVKEINQSLLKYKIFGGKDITQDFPELGKNALYCITEIHSQKDLEKLSYALKEVLQ